MAATEARTEPRTEKGISLARGPALILGTILLAAGLYFIYKQHFFPKFSNFPSGTATVKSKVLFGLFGANGWTGMLTAIAGGLLLFGAAQHFVAKTMSLIVGLVLAAAAIIGVLSSGNVLGLVSANHLTELAWGIAAVILLVNSLIPRRTRVVEPAYGARGARGPGGRAYEDRPGRRRAGLEGAAVGAGAGAAVEHERVEHQERTAERQGGAAPGAGGGRGGTGTGATGAGGAGAGAGSTPERETAVADRGAQGNETVVHERGTGDPGGQPAAPVAPAGGERVQASAAGGPKRSWLSRLRPGSGS